MDWVRSCYSSVWRFPETGDRDVRGYYYFTREPVRFYPGWSYFGSRNWHQGDGTPWPVYGEKEGVRQKWRNGSFPVRQPDTRIIGLPGCIDGTQSPVIHDPPTTLIHGVDIRCWQAERPPLELVGDGGGKLNTTAETSIHRRLLASGGGRMNSSATGSAVHTLVATGGGALDTAVETSSGHTLQCEGGVRANSTAASTASYFLEASGGAAGNTSATTEVNLSALIVSEVSSKTVGNTGTETTLLNGTYNLVSSNLATGTVFRLTAGGDVRFQNVASQVLTLRLKIGSTTVAAMQINSTNAGPVKWRLALEVTLRTLGAPGTASYSGEFICNVGTITVTTHTASGGTTSPTTTGNPALDLTAQWTTSAANNTITQDRVDVLQF